MCADLWPRGLVVSLNPGDPPAAVAAYRDRRMNRLCAPNVEREAAVSAFSDLVFLCAS